jgi:hypothetical protein
MTRLILIFFLLGLQNPLPAWGIEEGKPPENQAQSEQGAPAPSYAQTNALLFMLGDSSPYNQQWPDNTKKNTSDSRIRYSRI